VSNQEQKTTEQERAELHKAIWAIADDLRGAVDGWDFKNYVLGMMFYRYISENLQAYFDNNEHKAGRADFVYADLSDAKVPESLIGETIKAKGFFIYPSQLFCTVYQNAKNNEDLNITLSNIFRAIEGSTKGQESEASFAGLFDDIDLGSNKLGGTVVERNKRLTMLLSGVAKMTLRYTNNIDAFGDAYEYLMGVVV